MGTENQRRESVCDDGIEIQKKWFWQLRLEDLTLTEPLCFGTNMTNTRDSPGLGLEPGISGVAADFVSTKPRVLADLRSVYLATYIPRVDDIIEKCPAHARVDWFCSEI